MFDSQFCSQDDVLSVLDCGAHVALSMSIVTSDGVPGVVEASMSAENGSSKSACEDSGVQCPEMSRPTLSSTHARPKLSSMTRDELVMELLKWDSHFPDQGMTKETLQATLKQLHAANPTEKMPALSGLRKKELQDLCTSCGILYEAKD